jgi:hypothetical protein
MREWESKESRMLAFSPLWHTFSPPHIFLLDEKWENFPSNERGKVFPPIASGHFWQRKFSSFSSSSFYTSYIILENLMLHIEWNELCSEIISFYGAGSRIVREGNKIQ